jgi:DUF4097 and DUF4098 domain-containing protein YvlB
VLLLFIVLVPVSVSAGSADIDRRFDVEPGQELQLAFDEMRGDIDIQGWDEDRVEVKGRIRGRSWRDDDELEFDQSSHGIDIGPSFRVDDDDDIKVELTIKIPREFDVRIRANTDTRITGIRGELELSIANGDVNLDDVHGSGDISAVNGRLHVTNCTLDGEISSVNGRLTLDKSDIKGQVASVNGGVKVSRAPEGLEMESVNGSIDVGMAKDHVRAKTVNGKVTIDALDGWIEAETVNGAVRLRMVGAPEGDHSIDIETLNGNVEIEIPENFSMNFDVEVKNDGNRERYEIISDFDIDIQSETRRGRHKVTGKGEIGGGRNTVHIRARNGDVILKRAAGSR